MKPSYIRVGVDIPMPIYLLSYFFLFEKNFESFVALLT